MFKVKSTILYYTHAHTSFIAKSNTEQSIFGVNIQNAATIFNDKLNEQTASEKEEKITSDDNIIDFFTGLSYDCQIKRSTYTKHL